MATPAQIEANRANARKSTGPRTEEGKAASRRNALKHGLAAETLVLPEEEADAVANRVAAWTPGLAPKTEQEAWLVGEVALCSVRVERCQAHENAIRASNARRAATCWEADREAEVEELGAKLKRSPAIVAVRLKGSKQGCDWLIGRWEALGRVLDAGGAWDEAQERLALDLLGTPAEFREGPSPLDGDRRALVAEQVARLEAKKAAGMAELDELERSAAEIGLGVRPDRALQLARRYESACVRRLENALKQLDRRARPAPRIEADPVAESSRELARERAELARLEKMIARPSEIATPAPPRAVTSATTHALPGENRRMRRARKALARRA